jgi:hypothetical protein
MKTHFAALTIFLLFIGSVSVALPFEVIIESHSASYPRIGTSALGVLPNGSLLAVYPSIEAINATAGMFGKISSDGRIWGERFLVKSSEESYKAYPCSMLVVENKTMLFYDRFVNWTYDSGFCSLWMQESYDNGQTWIDDRQISSNHNYTVGTLNVLQMRNGTIILPFSWWEGRSVGRWEASALRSDDYGFSWQECSMIPDLYSPTDEGNDEPAMVELSNGSIYCVMRTYVEYAVSKHRSSVSNDYGLTWSVPTSIDEMFAIDSTPAIVRYSWEQNIVLASWINRTLGGRRTPLVIAVSVDDCRTWTAEYAIDNNENGTSSNDMTFCLFGSKILLSYRRYFEYLNMNDDSVLQVFSLRMTDFNFDGTVDIMDAIALARSFGIRNKLMDLNKDGQVDLFDVIIFSKDFGKNAWNISD